MGEQQPTLFGPSCEIPVPRVLESFYIGRQLFVHVLQAENKSATVTEPVYMRLVVRAAPAKQSWHEGHEAASARQETPAGGSASADRPDRASAPILPSNVGKPENIRGTLKIGGLNSTTGILFILGDRSPKNLKYNWIRYVFMGPKICCTIPPP